MRVFCRTLVLIAISLPSFASQQVSEPKEVNGPEQPDLHVFKSSESFPEVSDTIPPLSLPDGRLVVTAGVTIYMVAPNGKVSWRYSARAPLAVSPVFRADRNELAVVDIDATFTLLDAVVGRVLQQQHTHGSAFYSEVKPYGKGYLLVVDMTGYREKDKELGDHNKIPDQLYYQGVVEADDWRVDFPIGADLSMAGEHIYAVEYRKDAVTLQEIQSGSGRK